MKRLLKYLNYNMQLSSDDELYQRTNCSLEPEFWMKQIKNQVILLRRNSRYNEDPFTWEPKGLHQKILNLYWFHHPKHRLNFGIHLLNSARKYT